MDDKNDEVGVLSFFDDINAIGLIVEIDKTNGNIKTELEDRLSISDNTLSGLLDDAMDADLIKEAERLPSDHGRSKRFELTNRGRAVRSTLSLMGLDEKHSQYVAHEQRLKQLLPEVRKLIKADGQHMENIPSRRSPEIPIDEDEQAEHEALEEEVNKLREKELEEHIREKFDERSKPPSERASVEPEIHESTSQNESDAEATNETGGSDSDSETWKSAEPSESSDESKDTDSEL